MSAKIPPNIPSPENKAAYFDFFTDEHGVLVCREVSHLYTDGHIQWNNADTSQKTDKVVKRELFPD